MWRFSFTILIFCISECKSKEETDSRAQSLICAQPFLCLIRENWKQNKGNFQFNTNNFQDKAFNRDAWMCVAERIAICVLFQNAMNKNKNYRFLFRCMKFESASIITVVVSFDIYVLVYYTSLETIYVILLLWYLLQSDVSLYIHHALAVQYELCLML